MGISQILFMLNKKIIAVAVFAVLLGAIVGVKTINQTASVIDLEKPIRVGWIGDLSGSVAKWGALEATQIAVDGINVTGGIDGRKLEIIAEDGGCNQKMALNAAKKLVEIDKVRIILGGHCSPESLTIAPYLEQNKVLMMASITTSPDLTNAGEYIFRTSSINTNQTLPEVKYMIKNYGIKKIGILYEITGYAEPIARSMRADFEKLGGKVLVYEGVDSKQSDFRTQLLRMKAAGVDAVYISPQTQDHGAQAVRQIYELGLGDVKIFGNDAFSGNVFIELIGGKLAEGIVTGSPYFDVSDPNVAKFVSEYKKRFGVELPYGVWTADSYDSTILIAKALRAVGEDNEKIKEYLYGIQDYRGASGTFSIDKNGDGVREYVVNVIKEGKVMLAE